ncbi:MAG TPA: nucleotidyltransferase domain-containing protein [Thermodesulfobacteriota bacterium]|nr:nucleotidyltransferase domain-containing protein [Thermodesulfobacteriota bacterium]
MDDSVKEKLNGIILRYPQIKLVYLFGSQARGEVGPLSDYDFAIYFDEKDRKKMFDTKLELMGQLSRILGTDKVDIAILNLSEMPEFRFNVIMEGQLIYEEEPFRVIVEPKILNEYFDFKSILGRYGLTKS